jgi:glycosyltransferase involved in cell wall biosynthesis
MQIEKKVIIATHVLNYGAAHALRDYLIKKKYNLLFIGLPFYDQKNVIVEEYKSGELVASEASARKRKLETFNYVQDFYKVVSVVLLQKRKYDTFVGVNNLNCLAGLVLKRIGKVKRVIYYSIDFIPIRFSNKVLNEIYHQIEKFCVLHADEVWNVSPRIADGREEFLHLSASNSKQTVIPIGVWYSEIVRIPFRKVKKEQVLFIGHVLEKQGVQMVIASIPEIVKSIPGFHFLVIGDGDYLKDLKKQVKKLSVTKYVTFTGWIFDRKKLHALIGESAAGVAVYKPEKERLRNFSYFADPTKIKEYLSYGLPVILTNVPYNAQEVVKRHAGLMVEYKKENIAEAIISLLSNRKRLEKYRQNALHLAQEFDWNTIFSKTSL